jgi:hypothetical protein
MWVQLRAPKYVERNGRLHKYAAGSRINVGRMDAMAWVAAGEAVLLETVTGDLPINAGIVALGDATSSAIASVVRGIDKETRIVTGKPNLAFERTLLWDGSARLRPDMINVGFGLLAKWQMAVPLWSYTELACHIGSEEDRETTKAVIRDLRVPVYDTRVVFVRRCSDTQAFIREWLKERGRGDDKLAFQRALYRCKPVLCALPVSWTGKR